jgi:hypothetical protein
MQLQYYTAIKHHKGNNTLSRYFKPTHNGSQNQNFKEFSLFDDIKQYNGYIPSANFISYVYSSYISKLRKFMDQHTASLDGVVLKGDHSFKIIKHMGKINGVSTFSCLYTLVNEYEEIRLQVLAQSKSLKHLESSFNNMIESYRRLGMKMPQVFYTDNVDGDRLFLEKVIPSLLDNVQPVVETREQLIQKNDPFASYDIASLPADVPAPTFECASDIDTACQYIIDNQVGNQEIFIGLDCEWVPLYSRAFSAITRLTTVPKGVALVQISCRSTVFLFRVHKFTNETFPQKLAELLANPKIVKVGRNIGGDIKRLSNTFGVAGSGELELGGYCRDRDVVQESWRGLAYLCGTVLKRRLPKPDVLRCGDWEREELSDEQKKYAALDACTAAGIT